jgi:hypothetical protein
MEELDRAGYDYLTGAIRRAVEARFHCAVCKQAMSGRLSQVCYCPLGVERTHHINHCCPDFGPGRQQRRGTAGGIESFSSWLASLCPQWWCRDGGGGGSSSQQQQQQQQWGRLPPSASSVTSSSISGSRSGAHGMEEDPLQ